MIEEYIGKEASTGLDIVIQDGRPQIVEIIPELKERFERVKRLLDTLRGRLQELRMKLEDLQVALELLLREFRTTRARLAAYTAARRRLERFLSEARRAVEEGALTTRLIARIARYIGMPRTWVRYHPREALARLEELARVRLRFYDRYTRVLAAHLRDVRTKILELLEEQRRVREEIARIEEKIPELEEEYERVKLFKRVIYDNIGHLYIRETFSIETGERAHEPFVAEVHAETVVVGPENIRKRILEDRDRKKTRAVQNFIAEYFGALADVIIKHGIEYIYSPLGYERKRAFPNIYVEMEYAHVDKYAWDMVRDIYEERRRERERVEEVAAFYDIASKRYVEGEPKTVYDVAVEEGFVKRGPKRVKAIIRFKPTPPYYEVVEWIERPF